MLGKFVAEIIGTFVLVFVAAGSVMVNDISGGLVTLVGVALSTGISVMVMVYAIGNISGAHINPAVTFGFLLTRRLGWKEALVYWAAQIAGAVVAAGALRLILGEVSQMGANVPSVGVGQALGMEILITFSLVFLIMAVTSNQDRLGGVSGLVIGAAVVLGLLVGGPISGGSMNPARSLGPALIGWIWVDHWVFWAGPLLGASVGSLGYLYLDRIGAAGVSEDSM